MENETDAEIERGNEEVRQQFEAGIIKPYKFVFSYESPGPVFLSEVELPGVRVELHLPIHEPAQAPIIINGIDMCKVFSGAAEKVFFFAEPYNSFGGYLFEKRLNSVNWKRKGVGYASRADVFRKTTMLDSEQVARKYAKRQEKVLLEFLRNVLRIKRDQAAAIAKAHSCCGTIFPNWECR